MAGSAEAFSGRLIEVLSGDFCKRRLTVFVGCFVFELLAGGAKKDLENPYFRSVRFSEIHPDKTIFAVNAQVLGMPDVSSPARAVDVTDFEDPSVFSNWPIVPYVSGKVNVVPNLCA